MIGNIGRLLGPKCWDVMDELENYGGVARVQGLGGVNCPQVQADFRIDFFAGENGFHLGFAGLATYMLDGGGQV